MSDGTSERVLKFTVFGEPMGKPRMTRSDKWKLRDCVVRYRCWADRARMALQLKGGLPDDAKILDVSWVALFEPTKSWSKKKQQAAIGQLHTLKPDRDNIDKALLDALFKEDSHIAAGTLRKVWGEVARLDVTITYEIAGSADDTVSSLETQNRAEL